MTYSVEVIIQDDPSVKIVFVQYIYTEGKHTRNVTFLYIVR